MNTQRKKNESVKKDFTDNGQTSNKTRHKRGSTSQTAVSSLEESIQCNGLSTSSSKTPKSRSLSTSSSTEIGGQRRSARLSQIESQQTNISSPEKKKKKNDDQKTNKDKRKSGLNVFVEKGSEKSVFKRTCKLKDTSDTCILEQEENSDEAEEPAEKRSKRNSGRNTQNEIEGSSPEEENNESEAERHSSVPFPKLISKRSSKKTLTNELSSSVGDQDPDKTATNSSTLQDNENLEQMLKGSKRKKSTSSPLSSSLEKIIINEQIQQDHTQPLKYNYSKDELLCKVEVDDASTCDTYQEAEKNADHELKKKEKEAKLIERQKGENLNSLNSERPSSSPKSSKSTLQNNSHGLKTDVTCKKTIQTKTNLSPNKEDLVLEYNRSISEKISLLKPKAFVGRTSASFRKNIDDQNEGSGQEIDSDAESRRAIMESAQRRIEQNLSTSESDSRYFRSVHTPIAHSSKNDSSESDSAPETLSFSGGRQEAMESIKSAAEHVKREKQRLKERRKARLEMLKQQKEEKLIRLKEKMASQEDASCSSSEESGYEEEIRNARLKLKKKKAKSKTQHTEKENLDDATGQITLKPHSGAASDDSSDEITAPQEAASLNSIKRMKKEMFQTAPETIRNAKVHKLVAGSSKKPKCGRVEEMDKKDRGFKNLTTLDYIPLTSEGATKFMVVPLDKAMRAPKSLAEEAADFRQNMLYGSRIKREPAKNISAYQQKRNAANLNFHVR